MVRYINPIKPSAAVGYTCTQKQIKKTAMHHEVKYLWDEVKKLNVNKIGKRKR